MLIMIVDDDAEDLALFCEAATVVDNTIRFMVARDGQEALSLFERATAMPEYIFLDINMPKMNGKEFLVHAKKNSRIRSIPIIMYSTSSQTKEIEECHRLGAYDFLIKPPSFQKLVEDLRSIFIEAERVSARRR